MAYNFMLPGRTVFGAKALNASESYIKALGKKSLIVTGKIITKSGILKILTDLYDSWGLSYEVFNDITGEPTDKMIEAGVSAYKAARCDFITAIGGGSPLDSAKAIAAMTVLGGKISDYLGLSIEGRFPPLVLIPTTAGTGSEATKFTIITDTEKDIKMLLKGDSLIPDLAVIDPSFTLSSPPDITAATGMDALTHAVESYTSLRGNAMTDMYALDAIKRIFTFLPKAYKDGSDIKAREELATAAYEAGVCINNASVTLVHGMSRPIGALFHVPHGISNAMLISKCLSFALDGCYSRFAAIARHIGAADIKDSDKDASLAFISKLNDLCSYLTIPSLEQYGIDKNRFDSLITKMSKDAMDSGSPSNTIKTVTETDIIDIYKSLWE
jgi:alcohol dehydrogenase class IV